ncbi:cholesterol oxidase substrate-binding domain-containing protein [Bradyrhizobium oligotrophicum]|uniref:cholesterol oxidase substrate-binding domain-containing protein n=1 Tax=Bradyrhizobium oligotrophicum TaxID=44255 RepID=UPI003EBDD4D3
MSNGIAPNGFPSDIPVTRQTFKNWAQMIEVPNVWTCEPQSAEDVVRVCNWAAGAGFTVRPRGIMHGWSPLTVTAGESTANLMLVDLTKKLNSIVEINPARDDRPAQVTVQTGATMLDLMTALELAPGGNDGFSFAHIPAPGDLTVGGVLAINAHGTAVPTPPNDDFDVPYGSLSNQILAFTAIVTQPGSNTYVARRFIRGEGDDRAFLTHCGRALLVDVTLQITDNYHLRCQSFVTIPDKTLFAQPTGDAPPPDSVGYFLDQSGRVEVIWFPVYPIGSFPPVTSYPWLKVWTVAAEKPATSTLVTKPYNYPFSDTLSFSAQVSDLLKQILAGAPWLTPLFCFASAAVTSAGLNGELKGSPNSTDIWGLSKNTLLYVQDSTLRVTANGYAVLMRRAQVQQAVADFTAQFAKMIADFQTRRLWPINSPIEIRVTALDDPAKIKSHTPATSPVISSLSVDPVVRDNKWDVACWFDVLTLIPDGDPQQAYDFYAQLETWFLQHFSDGFRVCPEWSKGWAYTKGEGPWTDAEFIQRIRTTFTNGRPADDTWSWDVETLAKYDAAKLYSNSFLDRLFSA